MYRVSRIRVAVGIGIGVALLLAVLPLRDDRGALSLGIGGLVIALAWAFFASGLEYRVDSVGVRRRTRLGEVCMRWDQLEELLYRGEKRSINLVPVGTYVTLWLRDLNGRRLTIAGGGNYFGYLLVAPTGVDTLQARVVDAATGPLAIRLRSRVDAGETAALGPLTLSKASGIGLRSLTKSRTVGLDRLAGVGVHDGRLYFFERGEQHSLPPLPVAKVPNATALLVVLKGLGVPEVQMKAGFVRPSAV